MARSIGRAALPICFRLLLFLYLSMYTPIALSVMASLDAYFTHICSFLVAAASGSAPSSAIAAAQGKGSDHAKHGHGHVKNGHVTGSPAASLPVGKGDSRKRSPSPEIDGATHAFPPYALSLPPLSLCYCHSSALSILFSSMLHMHFPHCSDPFLAQPHT